MQPAVQRHWIEGLQLEWTAEYRLHQAGISRERAKYLCVPITNETLIHEFKLSRT
jgi:hypothetical protein